MIHANFKELALPKPLEMRFEYIAPSSKEDNSPVGPQLGRVSYPKYLVYGAIVLFVLLSQRVSESEGGIWKTFITSYVPLSSWT